MCDDLLCLDGWDGWCPVRWRVPTAGLREDEVETRESE